MRSWLAKAKSVHDIGGLYYRPKRGEPWDYKRDARAEEKWSEAGIRPLPISQSDLPFFGSRLHDSPVCGYSRNNREFRLHLDNINAKNLARNLASVLGVPEVGYRFRTDLIFHVPQLVRGAKEGPNGELRFADLRFLENAELLYDWFYAQDGRLQWIAQMWEHHPHKHRQIYLMVDCVRVSAADASPAAFEVLFGPPAAQLYAEALSKQVDSSVDFSVFDGGERTCDYIRQWMKARGLTKLDFRSPSSPLDQVGTPNKACSKPDGEHKHPGL